MRRPAPDNEFRPMIIGDYADVRALWSFLPGLTIRSADSRDAIERYLERNPGLSMVALVRSKIVGCALCGHDGRRGYLQHVVVQPELRGQGIGTELVSRCTRALCAQGIEKMHIDVLRENAAGLEFWSRSGWTRRDDLVRYSFTRPGNPNA